MCFIFKFILLPNDFGLSFNWYFHANVYYLQSTYEQAKQKKENTNKNEIHQNTLISTIRFL